MLPKLSVAGDLSYSKLFHTRGPATAKLLSPRVVRVCVEQPVFCRKTSGDDDDHACVHVCLSIRLSTCISQKPYSRC